jgi:hypothetical protein
VPLISKNETSDSEANREQIDSKWGDKSPYRSGMGRSLEEEEMR